MITKHIFKKTQHTKEPRGQPISSRCSQNTLSRKHNTIEPRGQPISSGCSQNTLSRKHNVQKSQAVSPFPVGDHKTQCQENTIHNRAKRSAHFQQVITKHIVKKTQYTKSQEVSYFQQVITKHIVKKTEDTKEPRGQPISRTLSRKHNTIEPRSQPFSSRWSQNTLSRKRNTQESQWVSPFPAGGH